MIILLYFDVFLVLKWLTNWKPLNKINLDIVVTDELGCLQGFFHVKPDKAPGPNFMYTELIIHVRAALNSWLHSFLFSWLRQLQFRKSTEEHL